MAIKGNPFTESSIKNILPIEGPRPKITFEKIELGSMSNRTQTEPMRYSTLDGLVGLQRKLLISLYNLTDQVHKGETSKIKITDLAIQLEKSRNSVHSLIYELVKKGAITRKYTKIGPNGWNIFELSESLMSELLKKKEEIL